MSFDNEYPNRKDRRKPYKDSKSFDRSCRALTEGARGVSVIGDMRTEEETDQQRKTMTPERLEEIRKRNEELKLSIAEFDVAPRMPNAFYIECKNDRQLSADIDELLAEIDRLNYEIDLYD